MTLNYTTLHILEIPGLKVIKQFYMKFMLHINVKMPTIVGILTFISRINTKSENLKARKTFIFQNFSFYEQMNFHAQLN